MEKVDSRAATHACNEKYICKVAKTVKEAKERVEAGFEYVTDMDNLKLFKKMKLTFLGSAKM